MLLTFVACESPRATIKETLWESAGEGNVEAWSWLVAAAEQEHADARRTLGLMYVGGKGVSADPVTGVRWLCAAAAMGDTAAAEQVVALAEDGHAHGQNALGILHLNGSGTPHDHHAAVRWFRAAAHQGHLEAHFNLGRIYLEGHELGRSAQTAAWFGSAARQGHAPAQNALGLLYLEGEGGSTDVREAVGWFRQAAEQGHADAQNSLGQAYALGLAVVQDDGEAIRWFQSGGEPRSRRGTIQRWDHVRGRRRTATVV